MNVPMLPTNLFYKFIIIIIIIIITNLFNKALLALFTLTQFRDHFLWSGAAYNGIGLSTSIEN